MFAPAFDRGQSGGQVDALCRYLEDDPGSPLALYRRPGEDVDALERHGQALAGGVVLAAFAFDIDPDVAERVAVVFVLGEADLLERVLLHRVHWLIYSYKAIGSARVN